MQILFGRSEKQIVKKSEDKKTQTKNNLEIGNMRAKAY